MRQPEHIQAHKYRLWQIELEARRKSLEIQALRLRIALLQMYSYGWLQEKRGMRDG